MDLGLDGKIALVTAASEGLGYACAKRLGQAGCRLAICARRVEQLDKARDGLQAETRDNVLAVPADLACGEDIARLLDSVVTQYGGLDILVANTGHIPYGGLFELGDAEWQAAFDLLVMGAVRLARGCAPIMRARGGGDMVFTSSAVAREPSAHLLLSNVFRVGVVALAKTLSASLGKDNIRVNSVTAGYFDTGRVRRRIDELVCGEPGLSRNEAGAQIGGATPLGRIGDAAEFAELVAFLVSRRAEFLTGTAVQIDGGASRGLF